MSSAGKYFPAEEILLLSPSIYKNSATLGKNKLSINNLINNLIRPSFAHIYIYIYI